MTFALGPKSIANMAHLHPTMVKMAHLAIAISPIDWGFTEPLCRTLAQQKEKVRLGYSKTLKSNHLIQPDGFGHAVDCVPWINGAFTWGDPKRFGWPVEIDGVTRYPFFEITAAWREVAIVEDKPLVSGLVWDRDLRSLPAGWKGIRDATAAYQGRRKALGKTAFLDGPHIQLGAP